jgi:hypothetical protein
MFALKLVRVANKLKIIDASAQFGPGGEFTQPGGELHSPVVNSHSPMVNYTARR